jgi:mono/diheme cytochrome c family protein
VETTVRKLVLLTVVATLTGCTAPADSTSDAVMTAEGGHVPVVLSATQQEGRQIYETMCWTCHGSAGRGDGPAVQPRAVEEAPSFQTAEYANATAESLLDRFAASMEGADPAHPHMATVASLLQPDRFAAALSFIPVLSYPTEIPGSALAGEKIYEARCTGCHGPDGRGDGPAAAALTDVKPQDFRTDTLLAARNWDGVFARIHDGGQSIHGSAMPPWGILLSEGEIWDVVAYLATFQPGLLGDPIWAN